MDDPVSRQAAIDALADYIHNVDKVYSTGKLSADDCKDAAKSVLDDLPSAQPYTEEEIQKMQDLEQAELEKAFESGREDAQSEIIRCQDCKFGLGHAHNVKCDKYYGMGGYDDFCSRAERRAE